MIMLINQLVKYNDSISLVFAALADPTRRSILAHLRVEDATVNELAAPHDMSLPAISKHLKILEAAGLISTTKDAQYRPRHLEMTTFTGVMEWLEGYR
jgi:DNA-binding transcriptional ArsR family regulator